MDVLIDAGRAIVASGEFPAGSPDPSLRVVPVADSQIPALAQFGPKTLAQDGTVVVGPLSPAQAQLVADLATRQQHLAALAQIKGALTGDAAKTGGDITAIQNLIAGIQAGTPPTQAQLLQIIRFLLRCLAAANA